LAREIPASGSSGISMTMWTANSTTRPAVLVGGPAEPAQATSPLSWSIPQRAPPALPATNVASDCKAALQMIAELVMAAPLLRQPHYLPVSSSALSAAFFEGSASQQPFSREAIARRACPCVSGSRRSSTTAQPVAPAAMRPGRDRSRDQRDPSMTATYRLWIGLAVTRADCLAHWLSSG
jgi:hypothetical protein